MLDHISVFWDDFSIQTLSNLYNNISQQYNTYVYDKYNEILLNTTSDEMYSMLSEVLVASQECFKAWFKLFLPIIVYFIHYISVFLHLFFKKISALIVQCYPDVKSAVIRTKNKFLALDTRSQLIIVSIITIFLLICLMVYYIIRNRLVSRAINLYSTTTTKIQVKYNSILDEVRETSVILATLLPHVVYISLCGCLSYFFDDFLHWSNHYMFILFIGLVLPIAGSMYWSVAFVHFQHSDWSKYFTIPEPSSISSIDNRKKNPSKKRDNQLLGNQQLQTKIFTSNQMKAEVIKYFQYFLSVGLLYFILCLPFSEYLLNWISKYVPAFTLFVIVWLQLPLTNGVRVVMFSFLSILGWYFGWYDRGLKKANVSVGGQNVGWFINIVNLGKNILPHSIKLQLEIMFEQGGIWMLPSLLGLFTPTFITCYVYLFTSIFLRVYSGFVLLSKSDPLPSPSDSHVSPEASEASVASVPQLIQHLYLTLTLLLSHLIFTHVSSYYLVSFIPFLHHLFLLYSILIQTPFLSLSPLVFSVTANYIKSAFPLIQRFCTLHITSGVGVGVSVVDIVISFIVLLYPIYNSVMQLTTIFQSKSSPITHSPISQSPTTHTPSHREPSTPSRMPNKFRRKNATTSIPSSPSDIRSTLNRNTQNTQKTNTQRTNTRKFDRKFEKHEKKHIRDGDEKRDKDEHEVGYEVGHDVTSINPDELYNERYEGDFFNEQYDGELYKIEDNPRHTDTSDTDTSNKDTSNKGYQRVYDEFDDFDEFDGGEEPSEETSHVQSHFYEDDNNRPNESHLYDDHLQNDHLHEDVYSENDEQTSVSHVQ